MISVYFQGKPFNTTVIQAYAPTSNAEEAEVNSSMKTYKTFRTNTQKRCPFHYRGLECKSRKSRMLSFKPTFPLPSSNFLKRQFSSSSLSAIGVVSSAYLRLLIFLPVILSPACASFSPVFLMMYSAYKLNKQCDNIQP